MDYNEEAFAKFNILIAIRVLMMTLMTMLVAHDAADTNDVYSPCSDARVHKGDGFSFGIAFSDKQSFFLNQGGPQLSPCDRRLGLSGKGAQLAVFRPMVDEISLLTINQSSLNLVRILKNLK